jgi:hypothetical protein
MISEKSARAMITSGEKYLYKRQLKELDTMIRDRAVEGKGKLDFHFPLEPSVIKALEKKGYKVNKLNYTYYTIYW